MVVTCGLALVGGMICGLLFDAALTAGGRRGPGGRRMWASLPMLAAALALDPFPATASDWSTTTAPKATGPAARSKPAVTAPAAKSGRPADHALSAQSLFLIRATLMTLNDANRTANYEVLRDLASPQFRSRYAPSDLVQLFRPLRDSTIDLAAAALEMPRLQAPPTIDAERRLRLAGRVPAQPNDIGFDLAFVAADGHWRLDGLSLAALPR